MLRYLLLTAALFLAVPAHAADTVLVPTSGWLVGPSTLVPDGEGGLPCVMTNQFNNGFTVRVSGGGGRIMGMALDVRQKFFTPGKSYDLAVAVPPGFSKTFKAEAYDASTIMMNAEAAPDLYKALDGASSMSMMLSGKTLEFVMLGADDGLARVENCFKPSGAKSAARNGKVYVPQQGEGGEKPVRAGMHTTNGVAAAYNKLQEQDALPAMTAAAPPATPSAAGQTMPPARKATAPTPPQPNAVLPEAAVADMAAQEPAAGSIDARLAQMFDRAETAVRNVQPAAASAGAPALQKAPAPPPNPIAASIPASLPIAPRAALPPRQVQVQQAPAPAQVRAAPESRDQARQWTAQAGVGLRETLDSWAQQAHARLVWQAPQDYMLPAGLTAQGTFESAVLSALKQFEGDDAPPLGQIYVDPVTGQKVLLVDR